MTNPRNATTNGSCATNPRIAAAGFLVQGPRLVQGTRGLLPEGVTDKATRGTNCSLVTRSPSSPTCRPAGSRARQGVSIPFPGMDTEEARTIGQRVRKALKSPDETQVVIAGLAWIRGATLSQIEHGQFARRPLPRGGVALPATPTTGPRSAQNAPPRRRSSEPSNTVGAVTDEHYEETSMHGDLEADREVAHVPASVILADQAVSCRSPDGTRQPVVG